MTHPGRFRKNNEDSFLALNIVGQEIRYLGKEGDAPIEEQDFIFAVSDGMGGAKSGEFASKITVEKISKLLPESMHLGALGMDRDFNNILVELVTQIHEQMANLGRSYEECKGMGATLSLCWFSGEWLHFAHVGDSRIYYLPANGEMKQVTHDHTYPGSLFRKGKINERQARTHPENHILLNALGGRIPTVDPQLGAIGLNPGDKILICSDGVNEGLWDRRIEELLRNPPARFADLPPAERLIKDAMEESGRDNITALIIDVVPSQ